MSVTVTVTGAVTRTVAVAVVAVLLAAAAVVTGARPALAGPVAGVPGTVVPTGPVPTLRPWISASYHPRDVDAGLFVPVVLITGGGFPSQAFITPSASVEVRASPTRAWVNPYRYVYLKGGFWCGTSAVLGEVCRTYAPGELPPTDLPILTAQAGPEPGCGARLQVRVALVDGSGEASTALFVPCTGVISP